MSQDATHIIICQNPHIFRYETQKRGWKQDKASGHYIIEGYKARRVRRWEDIQGLHNMVVHLFHLEEDWDDSEYRELRARLKFEKQTRGEVEFIRYNIG